MSARENAIQSLINGGYAKRQAEEILSLVCGEAQEKGFQAGRRSVMAEALIPEREQEIRETHPGSWYDGAWTQGYVESSGDKPAYCRVVHHESGTTLATLPDWASPIALFIADAHDAVPELLAELDRVRAERDQYATQLDGLHLAKWEDEQEAAESDTLPAWLYQRFMPDGTGWDNLDDDQRSYWEHQARAVRRAVVRNGFKAEGGDR